MFDVCSFEAKNVVFEFDHQQMNTFECVRCSKNDVRVRSLFDKMVFDSSLESTFQVMVLHFPEEIIHELLLFILLSNFSSR